MLEKRSLGADRVGVVRMTRERSSLFDESNRVTPSVTAPTLVMPLE